MSQIGKDELETMYFASADDFDKWLEINHKIYYGIWIKMAKQNSGIPSVTSDQAVDVGLCWGWISSHRKGFDSNYFLQKYTKRRPKSNWSKVNVDKVEMLTRQGLMRQPGIDEVELAKVDGRWRSC